MLAAVIFIAWCRPTLAQDTVTIPKSRLEELERKEAELQRLRSGATNAAAPNAAPASAATSAVSPVKPEVAVPQPVVAPAVSPVASLPPLKQEDIVDSTSLAGHFRADPPAAERYYGGRKFTVRGEIVGFEKPLMRQNYRILLQGPDRITSVVCDLLPPEKFTAVYPAEHGTQLVGQFGENKQVLWTLGQKVLVHGRCRGWKGNSVLLTADAIELATK